MGKVSWTPSPYRSSRGLHAPLNLLEEPEQVAPREEKIVF